MTIPYFGLKVFGPYTRKDGRKHVVLQDLDTRKLKTVSYPKYLVEVREGRYLETWETVDHKDDDFTNDDPDNLQILSRSANASKTSNAISMFSKCAECGIEFELTRNQRNKRGLSKQKFCSRECQINNLRV